MKYFYVLFFIVFFIYWLNGKVFGDIEKGGGWGEGSWVFELLFIREFLGRVIILGIFILD